MSTVLIVEDRAIDRKLLSAVLSSGGHHVVEASDGDEAIRVAAAVRPDVVISDILMPSSDGYELVRRMHEIPALAAIPVIFYTATYHEREARSLARQAGVARILTKPSESRVILSTIAAVLEGRQVMPADPLVERARFDREHLQLVSSTLASKIEDLEASERRMATIVDLAQQLAIERDPQRILAKACTAAREVTLAQHAVLALIDERAGIVPEYETSGFDGRAAALDMEMLHRRLVDAVIAQGRPLRTTSRRTERFGDYPVSSLLGVPIASATRMYGWIALCNKVGAAQFSAEDEQVVATLATHAAITYENACLYRNAVEANEQKDQFLAVLSHELRTPLNTISGWVRMLQEPSIQQNRLGHGLSAIERNCGALTVIISDLLDVAQIVRGQIPLDFQLVDLAQVVEWSLEAVRTSAIGKSLLLRADVRDQPCLVRGDRTRLQQIVSNVIVNAVKFTPEGGEVDVDLRHERNEACLTVHDTGIGIPAELLPRVFDRFWQADSRPTRVAGGLGIGLAITRDLVKLHGGSVTAISPGRNRGATFTVRLPLHAAGANAMTARVAE